MKLGAVVFARNTVPYFVQNPIESARTAVRNLLLSTLSKSGSGLSMEEADALTNICLMGVSVRGNENPREMIRSVSDGVLDRIVQNHAANNANPIIGKVFSIFFVEWCYRREYLEHDWAWKWKGPSQGDLYYKSKRPLEQILSNISNGNIPVQT
jgi:hypothetical protein